MKGHFTKSGVKPVKFIRELRLTDVSEYTTGQELTVGTFSDGRQIFL